MEHTFSIKDSIKFGWHTLKSHSGLVYKVLLTMLAVQVAYSVVGKVLEHTILGVLSSIVLTIASAVLGVGATLITLKLAKHEPATYADIVPPAMLVVRCVVASILAGAITVLPAALGVGISSVLIAVAGSSIVAFIVAFVLSIAGTVVTIYLALKFFFVKYAVLDGAGITDSLRKSSQMSKGIKWDLVFFMLAIAGINILGFIALLVGLLVTIPVTMLACAYVYTKLKHTS